MKNYPVGTVIDLLADKNDRLAIALKHFCPTMELYHERVVDQKPSWPSHWGREEKVCWEIYSWDRRDEVKFFYGSGLTKPSSLSGIIGNIFVSDEVMADMEVSSFKTLHQVRDWLKLVEQNNEWYKHLLLMVENTCTSDAFYDFFYDNIAYSSCEEQIEEAMDLVFLKDSLNFRRKFLK